MPRLILVWIIVPIVSLPPVEPLLSLLPETWRALGRRLAAIGVDRESVTPLWEMPARGDPLRSPMMKWRLRRMGGPCAHALRMFMFWDPVTPDEARAALGDDVSLERLLAVGLLHHAAGGIVSPFAMKLGDAGRLYLVCDDTEPGGDAVMGPSEATTTLSSFARPRVRAGRGLDLGCGAGTVALTMASMCERVVATDVNPRAVILTKVNAWINGIDNVDVRVGDLFEPVQGETFDVVASQPPFIPFPPDVPPTSFVFGGDRGDEIALRILRDLPAHLSPGGVAAFMVTWPVIEGAPPLGQRLREALGASQDLSLLLLQAPLDDERAIQLVCTAYARMGNGSNDGAFERDVLRYREHFDSRGIRALQTAFTFVRRDADDDTGWTSVVESKDVSAAPSRETVDLLFAAGDLAFRRLVRERGSPGDRRVTIDTSTRLPTASVLALAHEAAGAGADAAFPLYRDLHASHPGSRAALLGVARRAVATGSGDEWISRLRAIAAQGDREARRLLGDIDWRRGDIDAALAWYVMEARPGAAVQQDRTPSTAKLTVELARRPIHQRPFLVWVTCARFDGSAVAQGLQVDGARQWDLAVNRFVSSTEPIEEVADYVVEGGISKLSSVKAAVAANPGLLGSYRALLFLDDDIGITHEDVDRFFWIMSRYQLDLAHPSLTEASSSPHAALFHQREAVVRFVTAVDVRAPAFSQAGFASCVDSFDQAIGGAGLGSVWAHLLRHRRHATGVVDAVAVPHLRPIDPLDGPFYKHLRSLGIEHSREGHDVQRRYGCRFVSPRTLGDVDAVGRERHYPE